MASDYADKSNTINLIEVYNTAGLSSMNKSLNEPHIETVERCKVCLLGFKSRWGEINKCSDHSHLETTPIPKTMKKLRK